MDSHSDVRIVGIVYPQTDGLGGSKSRRGPYGLYFAAGEFDEAAQWIAHGWAGAMVCDVVGALSGSEVLAEPEPELPAAPGPFWPG